MNDDTTPQISDIRTRMLDLALSSVGLGVNRTRTLDGDDGYTGARGDGYMKLIADGESSAMARAMGNMSGCALVVRGLWRLIGFDDARLRAPYRVGTAVELLFDMAHEAGAVVSLDAASNPDPGDVFLLTTPQEHVATFMRAYDAPAGNTRASVDGGQRDVGGGELVTQLSRVRSGSQLGGRTVGAVINLDAIAARFGGAQ